MRPGIVHRIDKDTTGVIIACKNDMAHNSIAAQLKEHSVTRRYQAIVHGNMKEETGTIDSPIGRHPTERKRDVRRTSRWPQGRDPLPGAAPA